jgi:hypothetical protein
MSKAKAPFQLLIVDDDGREMFSTYVGIKPSPSAFNLKDTEETSNLYSQMAQAVRQRKVDKNASKWYAH